MADLRPQDPGAPLLIRLLLALLADPIRVDTVEIGLDILAKRLGPASRAEIAEAVRDGVGQGLLHEPVRLPPGALQCHWHLELTPRGRVLARTSGSEVGSGE
jgi:hypothetical protein